MWNSLPEAFPNLHMLNQKNDSAFVDSLRKAMLRFAHDRHSVMRWSQCLPPILGSLFITGFKVLCTNQLDLFKVGRPQMFSLFNGDSDDHAGGPFL